MLASQMDLANTPLVRLVVCGGASLIATKVISRSTKDVDIVALRSMDGSLIAPVPLPEFLLQAAAVVARNLGLDARWLNNGPSQDEGGLFQMGLPAGFAERLTERVYGPRLTVYFMADKTKCSSRFTLPPTVAAWTWMTWPRCGQPLTRWKKLPAGR